MESELREREKVVAEKEEELNELRRKASAFPKEMEAAVTKAVKETIDRLTLEPKIEKSWRKKNLWVRRMFLRPELILLRK